MQKKHLVFALGQEDGSIKGAVIKVVFDGESSREAINAAVTEKLKEICEGDTPYLIAEIGVPDIRIVIDKASVGAVYVRNCDMDPNVEVVDMDLRISNPLCEQEFMREHMALDTLNTEEGFRFIPHLEEEHGN